MIILKSNHTKVASLYKAFFFLHIRYLLNECFVWRWYYCHLVLTRNSLTAPQWYNCVVRLGFIFVEDDVIINDDYLSVYVRQWCPSEFVLGPFEEIFLYQETTVAALVAKVVVVFVMLLSVCMVMLSMI